MSSADQPTGLPTSFACRAAPALIPLFVVALMALAALVVDRPLDGVRIGPYVVVAVGIVIRAGWCRQRPALSLDADGIRSQNGSLLVRWDQVALIWVGDEHPRWVPHSMRALSLRAYDASALDYSRRTGFTCTPRLLRLWVPTTLTVADTVALIRSHTRADVRTGSTGDLRRLLHDHSGSGSTT